MITLGQPEPYNINRMITITGYFYSDQILQLTLGIMKSDHVKQLIIKLTVMTLSSGFHCGERWDV
jgi:hypothetical protein